MHRHGQQASDEARQTVKPVPGTPVPAPYRHMIAVVVVDILELHATDEADTHEQRSEERHDEDAHKMFPAVALR